MIGQGMPGLCRRLRLGMQGSAPPGALPSLSQLLSAGLKPNAVQPDGLQQKSALGVSAKAGTTCMMRSTMWWEGPTNNVTGEASRYQARLIAESRCCGDEPRQKGLGVVVAEDVWAHSARKHVGQGSAQHVCDVGNL